MPLSAIIVSLRSSRHPAPSILLLSAFTHQDILVGWLHISIIRRGLSEWVSAGQA